MTVGWSPFLLSGPTSRFFSSVPYRSSAQSRILLYVVPSTADFASLPRCAQASLSHEELQMIGAATVVLALSLMAPVDTGRVVAADSLAGPVASNLVSGVQVQQDTVRRRRKSIEVSDWYERRLRIHRYGSFAIYPLFALQAVAGNQLFQDPKNAPDWAKTGHRVGATGLATVFTLNTVTGLWNLWDSREVEQGRSRRYTHALLMLASDAGFTYAGLKLSEEAEQSFSKREDHKRLAYGSMATALSGVALMTFWKEK